MNRKSRNRRKISRSLTGVADMKPASRSRDARDQRLQAAGGNPIQKFDKNGDGKISMEEAPPPMKANFSQHDTNGDGWIDAEEAKSLPTPGRQGGGPGGGGQPPQ
jgi:hypothetical protein